MGRGITVRLRYIHEFRDRHGKLRRYFRAPGLPRLALPGIPGSPEFMEAYNAALAGEKPQRPMPGRALPGSISAAVAGYYCDASFTSLADHTRQARRAILEKFRAQYGALRIATLRSEHIAKIVGPKKPFVGRDWFKAIRGLMRFAVAIGLRPDDPTVEVTLPKLKAGTIHTWSEDEIAAFEAHHSVGSRPRLALAILLYTAARRSDAVRLGPQNLRNGRLFYRQQKTGRTLEIPIHLALAAVIRATPSAHLTFMATAYGKPFTAVGFGNSFRKWCRQAGLPHCTPHGLRKAAARRLAEAGCSAHEIASITGHKTLSEVQRYADAANQAKMAESALAKVQNL